MHEGKRKRRERRGKRGAKQFAIEEPFILRVPEQEEPVVKSLLREGRLDAISLTFDTIRKAKLVIEEREYHAELVDLPCIVEAHKTFDRSTYYKVADVSQMIVARNDEEPHFDRNKVSYESRMLRRDPDIAYQWKHGLTGPFWNVRERRFRRRAARRIMDDVESEVRRLLAADANATEVKHKFFDEERDDVDDELEEQRQLAERTLDKESDLDEEGFTMLADLERDLVEPTQEKEEYNEEDEQGDEDEDDEESTSEEEEVIKEDSFSSMQRRANALREKKSLEEVIRDLEEKIEKKLAQMRTIPNLLLRKRFEDTVKEMRLELETKKERLQQVLHEL